MAGIKFSRKEFEKHFKLTEELKEKISLFGTHFESANDEEIELEITPNRPDLFSLQRFIVSFSAFIEKTKGIKEYKVNKPQKNFQVTIDKNTKDIRPFTACAIIKDIKFDDEKIKEIINIQEKIHTTLGRNRKKIAIGIYPLEEITLPIRFETRKPSEIRFMPLESDREMNAFQILQTHPTGREYAHLLEGTERYPVFVDAKNEILSMPPIINSHKTGKVRETTKDIFIECSGFDFEILKKTINILSTMFADMGGKIFQMQLNYANKKEITPNLIPEKIKININNVNQLLGLSLKENEIKKLLERMGHNYNKGRVEIPAWRTDIMHEVDIIEDIAIAYGYNNFVPEIPSIATAGEINKIEILNNRIAQILSGLNILEISSYHLLTKDDSKLLNLKDIIEVENSKSEYKILRPSLLAMSLKTLKNNIDSEYPQRIFEIGKVFEHDKDSKTEIKEPNKLSISIANNNSGFTEMKQTVEYLLRMLGKLKEYRLESSNNPNFIEGRCARLILNDKALGEFGEIKPQILENLGIKMPVTSLEIEINELIF